MQPTNQPTNQSLNQLDTATNNTIACNNIQDQQWLTE
jgi:hypothetical protein